MAAAVADFRPAERQRHQDQEGAGEPARSRWCATPTCWPSSSRRAAGPGQVVVGFAAETGDADGDVLAHGRAKLAAQGLRPARRQRGRRRGHPTGFEGAQNAAVVLGADGRAPTYPSGQGGPGRRGLGPGPGRAGPLRRTVRLSPTARCRTPLLGALCPAACSPPSPSPRATPTRSPTRSATRSSTRCSSEDPQQPGRRRDPDHHRPGARRRRGHHRGLRRHPGDRPRADPGDRLRLVDEGLRRRTPAACRSRSARSRRTSPRASTTPTRTAPRATRTRSTGRAPATRA